MLQVLPTNHRDLYPNHLAIITFDPGTVNFGIGIGFLNMHTCELDGIYADTINGDKLTRYENQHEHIRDRFKRINTIKKGIKRILAHFTPSYGYSENNFFNTATPEAGKALAEIVLCAEQAFFEYNPNIPLIMLSPLAIKAAISVRNFSDKNAVKEAVKIHPSFIRSGKEDIDIYDEHSIDTIALLLTIEKHFLLDMQQNDRSIKYI